MGSYSQNHPAGDWPDLGPSMGRLLYESSSFTITQFYFAAPGNFQYRVYGMGTSPSCPNSPNRAYLEDTNSGAKAYVAALLSAFHAGKQVSLYLTPVNGYRRIGKVIVQTEAAERSASSWVDTTSQEGKNLYAMFLAYIAMGRPFRGAVVSGYASGAVSAAGT